MHSGIPTNPQDAVMSAFGQAPAFGQPPRTFGQAPSLGPSTNAVGGAVKFDFDLIMPQRANTAPLVQPRADEESVDPNDPRCTQEYADWYYAQVPRNPRALPPIGSYAKTIAAAGDRSQSPKPQPPQSVAPPLPVDANPAIAPQFSPNANAFMPNMMQQPPPGMMGPQGMGLFAAGIPQMYGGQLPYMQPGAFPPAMPYFQPQGPVQPMYGGPQHPQQQQREAPQSDRGKGRMAAPRPTRRTTTGPCSPLMDDFRSRRRTNLTLAELKGNLREFAKDQEGSRHIQAQLMTCTPEEKEYTFREIMADFHELVSDVFANYVLQKLIEVATPAQQTEVYETVKNNVLTMTLQTYGCRIVQKCLESFDRPTQDLITSELHGNVARCIQDQNGNHVIQKCIEIMPERAGFIVDSFRGVVHDLATHAYGCRVIQRVLEFCSEEQQSQIFVELRENIEALVCDQYGNYVIQHVLCHGTATQRADIIALLTPNSFIYSTHKFASNVVEKMYEHSNADQREAMLQALMQPTSDGCSGLLNMMKDQYANYVIQKIIDLSSDDQKKRVVEHIRPHVPTLRKFTYGKHIIARLERSSLLPSSGNHSQPPSPPAPVRGNTNANPSQAMPMQGFPPTTGYYGQHYGMQQQPLQHPGMRY